MKSYCSLFFSLCCAITASGATGNNEADYYKITNFETPKDTALEVGSIDLMPEGKLVMGTRRGEIWVASGVTSSDANAVQYTRFASGQHEVLGIAYKDETVYATNRYEITKMKDTDGDGKIVTRSEKRTVSIATRGFSQGYIR